METFPRKTDAGIRNGVENAAPRFFAPVLSYLLLRLTSADQAE